MCYKHFIAILLLFSSQSLFSQCSECPNSSIIITGNQNINEQNNAQNYCIDGQWTGNITNIANNSTLTICPNVSWGMPNNITLQKNIVFNNYGSITDNGNGYKLFIQGQTTLNNQSNGSISVDQFENQDAEFNNYGDLVANDIYFHGKTSNSGTITSNADCGGNASSACGFYVGNKVQPLNNSGTINTIDATIKDGIIGGGTFNSTGTFSLENNSDQSDNFFNLNNVKLQASSNINTGSFTISGTLDCNNANINTAFCFTETAEYGSNCSGSSNQILSCQILPVTIIDFDVVQTNNKLLFTWEVQSEVNVSHYEILVSYDGKSYNSLSKTLAENERYYQNSELNRNSDVSYFRLKSVDFDGKESLYSETLMIKESTKSKYTISPNPVSIDGVLNISFNEEQKVLISIHSLDGQKIKSNFYENQHRIELDLHEIVQSGLYIVKILTQNQIYTEEIFIK